jgi:hypothetical protein
MLVLREMEILLDKDKFYYLRQDVALYTYEPPFTSSVTRS